MSKTVILAPGHLYGQFDLVLDDVEQATVVINSPSEIAVTIISPSKEPLPLDETSSFGESGHFFSARRPQLAIPGVGVGYNYLFSLPQPIPGIYKISLTSWKELKGITPVVIGVSLHTSLDLRLVQPKQESAIASEDFSVFMLLTESSNYDVKADVSARLVCNPQIGSVGALAERHSSGIYSASLRTDSPANCAVIAEAKGTTKSGVPFYREARSTPFEVRERAQCLAGVERVAWYDVDGDGLFDTLALAVQAYFSKQTHGELRAELLQDDGKRTHLSSLFVSKGGATTIWLTEKSEDISCMGGSLAVVALDASLQMDGVTVVDSIRGTVAETYVPSNIQQPPGRALHEPLIDFRKDGQMFVRADVFLSHPGDYRWDAMLRGHDNHNVHVSASACLPRGRYSLDIGVDWCNEPLLADVKSASIQSFSVASQVPVLALAGKGPQKVSDLVCKKSLSRWALWFGGR